jgi:hypothetical protein
MRAERLLPAVLLLLLASGPAQSADKSTRFWNLTNTTISEFPT